MPELPEVETIRNLLSIELTGQKLTKITIINKNFSKKYSLKLLNILKNQTLNNIQRKGKYLVFVFEKEGILWHLGLTGALILFKNSKYSLNKHSILFLEFENKILEYRDIRKFGKIKLFEIDKLYEMSEIKNLGEDALKITLNQFRKLFKNKKGNIKLFLLNQRNIAGLGNIYTDELLFRARISPLRKVESLKDEEITKLFYEMKKLLYEAIKLKGSSIRDYVDIYGERGQFQEKHLVYGKRGQLCPECGNLLSFKRIGQRGTTFCPVCQT